MERMRNSSVVACTAWLVAAMLYLASEAHAQPAAATDPPSTTMQHAIERYQARDYYPASVALGSVLALQTQDSEATRARAELLMGTTLYQLKYYAAALLYFGRIANRGPSHPHHEATLEWLATLSRVLPERSGILHTIGSYDPKVLQSPSLDRVRDELSYLTGWHHFRRGQLDQAIEHFRGVRNESPLFLRARFMEGVAQARDYRGVPALEAFKELLVIGRTRPPHYAAADIERFEQLAALQIARLFYSTQQYELALEYYGKISPRTPGYPASLHEAAWSHLLLSQPTGALARLHTLGAPFSNAPFRPEAAILESFIYFKSCLYGSALGAVHRFDGEYGVLSNSLKAMLRRYEDDAELFEYVEKVEGATGRSKAESLLVQALGDRGMNASGGWIAELDRELQQFDASPKSWQTTEVASEILQELTLQRALAAAEAGKLARQILDWKILQLRDLSRDGIKVRFEVHEADEAEPARPEERAWEPATDAADHGEPPLVLSGDHLLWKFNKGFGKGRQGDYRFRLRSNCPGKAASPVRGRPAGPPAAGDDARVQPYDFSNDLLDGDLYRPDGTMMDIRAFAPHIKPIHVPRDFVRELILLAEQLRGQGVL